MDKGLKLRLESGARPGAITVRYVHPRALSAPELDALWAFFSQFVERARPAFEEALSGADEVLLAHDERGDLCGFVALTIYDIVANSRRASVIYTHWSAVAPAYRGRNLIPKAGLRCYVRERLRHPTRPIYWMFGASTYKSYLLLPRYYEDYWPRRGAAMPTREAAVLAEVMKNLADPNWDAEHGVIHRFGTSRYHEGVVEDEPQALVDPNVRFYAEKNPGQTEGDTLMCLCPLTLRNLTSIVTVMLKRAVRRGGSRSPSEVQPEVRRFDPTRSLGRP